MYPSSFILRMPTPNRAVARFGLRDMFILINGHFYVSFSFLFLVCPPPNRAAARLGLRDVFIFLMGIFLCHSNFIFRMSMLQIELLPDLD